MFSTSYRVSAGALALACAFTFSSVSGLQGMASAQDTVSGAAGSAEGLYRQGVDLVYSSNVFTANTRQGIDLLEKAADAGSVDALLQLGSLNLYGLLLPRDWDVARTYFERAAQAGNWSGIAEYGAMLMWTERDWREGQKLLTEAAEQGVTSAWVTLAEGAMYGYLGGGRHSRAKFAAFAERARAAGEPRIAVLESQRFQWGISLKANGSKAVTVLQDAAEEGNAVAALALVNLLRDGNGQNVGRNLTAARSALLAYAPLLTETQKWQQERALQAAEARSESDLAALAEEVLAHGNLVTKDFGNLLVRSNLNAAIYVLQVKLAAAGADIGPPDGKATSRTLAAMYAACMVTAPPAWCNDSVMREDVISALFMMR